MSESENTIQEAIDDLIEKYGPLELDAEAVQRSKDAEKKERRRRRIDGNSGGNSNETKHET